MPELTIHNRYMREKNSSNWFMKLAGCKPFCTGCLSFLPLHELRCKHLQMLVAVPSAEAMLLGMLRAISRDLAWPATQQCLPLCYIWKWGFCSRASSFVKHLSACLNAHLLQARNTDSNGFLVAWRKAAFNQGYAMFQLQETQVTKVSGGGTGSAYNFCHLLCHQMETWWRVTPMDNTVPKEVPNMAWGTQGFIIVIYIYYKTAPHLPHRCWEKAVGESHVLQVTVTSIRQYKTVRSEGVMQ